MQDNTVVWKQYLRDVLSESIEEPSVVLMNNFECHVYDESYKIIHEELGSHLCALSPNATSKKVRRARNSNLGLTQDTQLV
ncbi:hypothetical protein H257_17117 [Aphanomyces astaci]|uniref:DDE-1 domain-containing protein n=1 Tax=Aphanomyces astaci TaxID=112090 RepID=W4FHV9_APHAT|nr:hypothetical protein H257_17117 [Aphanomyces astaci]ETV66449.1 hypothetical protein H257_17117 [Aphanomyces astaci]|eukprot:XP_009844083.1 hypothetical protein H257_17117 [Aphanomyces astaci]